MLFAPDPKVIKENDHARGRILKPYCDKWSGVFRSVGTEMRSMTDILLKWMAYDQGLPANTGSKWTKDEEELLRQALLTHGTDMDKLCEALPARTEQAIRAAVKRKMDPDLVQRLGPLKRRRTAPLPEAIQESSPLASYFQTKSQPSVPLAPVVGDVVAKDGEGIKPAPGTDRSQVKTDRIETSLGLGGEGYVTVKSDIDNEEVPLIGLDPSFTAKKVDSIDADVENIPNSDKSVPSLVETGNPVIQSTVMPSKSFFGESGVQLTDQDFLALLEDDPAILGDALMLAGIPPVEPIRVRSEPLKPEDMLRELRTDAIDLIFFHNFKDPLREIAMDLGIFAEREETDVDENPVYDSGSIPDAHSMDAVVAQTHEMLNGTMISEQLMTMDEPVTGSELEQYLMESDAAVEQLLDVF